VGLVIASAGERDDMRVWTQRSELREQPGAISGILGMPICFINCHEAEERGME
jgi:hypothetical protein